MPALPSSGLPSASPPAAPSRRRRRPTSGWATCCATATGLPARRRRGAEEVGGWPRGSPALAAALPVPGPVAPLPASAYVGLLGCWSALSIAAAVIVAYVSTAPDADDEP